MKKFKLKDKVRVVMHSGQTYGCFKITEITLGDKECTLRTIKKYEFPHKLGTYAYVGQTFTNHPMSQLELILPISEILKVL